MHISLLMLSSLAQYHMHITTYHDMEILAAKEGRGGGDITKRYTAAPVQHITSKLPLFLSFSLPLNFLPGAEAGGG